MSAAAPKPAITPGGPIGRLFVAAALGLLRALPLAAHRALAAFIAGLAWALRIRRAVALDNLAHAFPEKSPAERLAIARGAYRNMASAALEAVTSDLIPDAQLTATVTVADWKGLDAILDAKQPALIASAHLGSWELFAEVMARRGYAASAVVRPLTGAFNAWVVENRRKAGVELILQRGALKGMLQALKRGRPVVQLIDQVLPARHGVFVPFFGRLASTTPAISVAAMRSGAPVYVVVALRKRDGSGLEMRVEGPLPLPSTDDRHADLTAHTAQLTAVIERFIREAPEQWLWLHRRWKVKPEPTGSVAAARPPAPAEGT